MKEFNAQTGGRYTYVDDILNLQNLALAFGSIFNGCDNFIVSGCNIKDTVIESGYVYIGGKLRYFSGATGITVWPQYIYENNSSENVAYENGADKVGRSVYGCLIGTKVPTVLDPLTQAIPQSIFISSTGGMQLNDALFGKYALLLQSSSGNQTVNGVVNFTGAVNVSSALTAKGRSIIQSGNSIGQMYWSGRSFIVQSQTGSGAVYQIILSESGGFSFNVNNINVLSVGKDTIACKIPITSNTAKFGNIKTTGSEIYNDGVSSDSGGILINCSGYNGGNQFFRNTYIGNGKGAIIMTVDGKNSTVAIDGQLDVYGANAVGLSLKSNYAKISKSLRKTISWMDYSSEEIAYLGYNSTQDNVFYIHNNLANISITGLEAVNLGPAIMENGALLSQKYVLTATLTNLLKDYVKSNDVYTGTNSDQTFAKLSGGLSQFIPGTTQSVLRSQIDAVSLSEVLNKVPALDKFLSDMGNSEANKKKICTNIGAAYESDFQPKMKDTGWVSVQPSLYARQIGNVVSIQGLILFIQSGTVFTLPTSIDPPSHPVTFTTVLDSYQAVWRCYLNTGSRTCQVGLSTAKDSYYVISFSITYMV
jgi:hypothetical protein